MSVNETNVLDVLGNEIYYDVLLLPGFYSGVFCSVKYGV